MSNCILSSNCTACKLSDITWDANWFICGGIFIYPQNVSIAAYPPSDLPKCRYCWNIYHMVQGLMLLSVSLLIGMINETTHILCTVT